MTENLKQFPSIPLHSYHTFLTKFLPDSYQSYQQFLPILPTVLNSGNPDTLGFRTTKVPVNEIRGQRTGVSWTTKKIANGTIIRG